MGTGAIKVVRGQGMPSYRHHDFGNLYIQFDVRFPQRLTGPDGESSLTEEQIRALEGILPPRIHDSVPPPDSMVEDYQLEDIDPTREQQRSRGVSALDDDDDDMHPGAERVQCAPQ
jgi:DnaJ homolog subfamily A member 2